MVRLTEEMVIARTRASDLSTIKKLNCWGVELSDVSLLRRMTNVEVLSLSVNNISSLSDFQHCKMLQELYVRKNNIKNLNEIMYLQNLPHLRNLWLGENPCADVDMYRLTVLKTLPRLQKLDDVIVQPEEVQDAMRKGRDLVHPEDCDNSLHISPSHSPTRASRSPPSRRSSDHDPDSSGSRKSSYSPDYDEHNYTQNNDQRYIDNRSYTQQQQQQQQQSQQQQQQTTDRYVDNRNYQQYRRPSDVTQNYEENYNHAYERHVNPGHRKEVGFRGDSRRGSSSEGSGRISPQNRNEDDIVQQQYDRTYRQCQQHIDSAHQRLEADKLSRPPPYPRRPITRSSNLLSAVMCLIKELDYPSLEVVEMAVKCRMDELED